MPPCESTYAKLGCAAILWVATAGGSFCEEPPRAGAEIFQALCADCHGQAGQGGHGYELPLEGDLPPTELARVIADTMPEGEPEACVGDDALAVAEFVHREFYSPFARVRNRPPRHALSRLTARQYEQTLADLVGGPRRLSPPEKNGVRATFELKVNVGRIEEPEKHDLPRLAFKLTEFEALPERYRDPDAEGPEEFGNKRIHVHARFRGGIYAPRTGRYDFVVRGSNGFELTLNREVLIDARVRSGEHDELRDSTRLVGGRVYPIELYVSRTREEDLEFEVLWRPPGGVEEPIPTRALVRGRFPAVYAVQRGFPADDRSRGFVHGAEVSQAWHEAVTDAALAAAEKIVDDLPRYAGAEKDADPTVEQASEYCRRIAEAAFRRPLTEEETDRFVTIHFASASTDAAAVSEAVERSLLGVLTNGRFLYPELGISAALEGESTGALGDYAAASGLALALWDSLPDARLLSAAAGRELSSEKQVRKHARRMLGDLRTRSKLNRFFEHWLLLDRADSLSRDRSAFPNFDERVASDMRASLERMIDDAVWQGGGDFRGLFLTDRLYVNDRLARFLGMESIAGSDDEFVPAAPDHEQRVGIVTHPYLVGALAYHRETSPIHRGVFLARNVLGRSLRPPPEAVAPLAPELAPDLTTRERVAVQTDPAQCQTCHVLINNLGFPLEHFDAVGRFRDSDGGRPIDASGGYVSTDGDDTRLSSARELAAYLAESGDVHRAFVVQLFEHLTNQPLAAYGPETEQTLLDRFRERGFNVRELLVESATLAAHADGERMRTRLEGLER